MAITAPISLIFLAIIVYATIRAGTGGGLRRNDFIGIRTRWTLASDDAWHAGHKAAHHPMLAACILGACLGTLAIVAYVAGIATKSGTFTDYSTLALAALGYLSLVTLILVGTARANRAAKKTTERAAYHTAGLRDILNPPPRADN